ncbi:MAG: hypothetical protein JW827_00660 [Spirochaetes bacterium]|nr:hypothetical protein [Spirochaetota bacterium]
MLKKIWKYWKKFGLFIGTLIGIVISTVLYIVVISPFGIIISLFADYLGVRSRSRTNWVLRKQKDLDLESMRRQY